MMSAPKKPMMPRKGLINGTPCREARNMRKRDLVREEMRGLVIGGIFGIFMIALSVLFLTGLYQALLP